jgi:hypothetical protein
MYLTQFVKADHVTLSVLPLGISPKKPDYKNPNRGYPSRLGKRLYELASKGVLLDSDGKMIVVYCKEHDRHEVVFALNHEYDLKKWYTAGIHPRFSIAGALLKANQILREINRFMEWRQADDDELVSALRASKTQEQFLKAMAPHLFTTLKIGRRRIRISQRTKEKYEAKSFTVQDFLREENQEMRRVIARIIPVKEVLKHMKVVAKDEEGTLYEYVRDPQRLWDRRRYLHVTCPSTAQDYLLEVPERFTKPKEARRWTFNLPVEAEFSKEA